MLFGSSMDVSSGSFRPVVRVRLSKDSSDQSNTKGDWESTSRALDFIQQQKDKFRRDKISDVFFDLLCGGLEAELNEAKITTLKKISDYFIKCSSNWNKFFV